MVDSPASAGGRTGARRVAPIVLAWCLVLAWLPGPVGIASADAAADEHYLAARLNDLRASRRLSPLAVDAHLTQVAREWSARMAAAGRLSHNPDLATAVAGDWTLLGQNVGAGATAGEIHDQLVGSAGHLANMVSPSFNAVGIGSAVAGGRVWITQVFMQAPASSILSLSGVATSGSVSSALSDGRSWYRLVGTGGETYGFGAAPVVPGVPAPSAVVGAAGTASGAGGWLVTAAGAVLATGDAPSLGSLAGTPLSQPIVGMAATPTGRGYWLVGRDGGVFAFGDARFLGSTGDMRLNQPVVGMAASPTGNGYWFVAADGGVFSFGDAAFLGSTGGLRLRLPVVGMASTPGGGGYWLVARDGGVFAFGDAAFLGSTGDITLAQPIVAMSRTTSGNGYRFVAADGGVFSFGDASFLGSTGGRLLASPVAAMISGG